MPRLNEAWYSGSMRRHLTLGFIAFLCACSGGGSTDGSKGAAGAQAADAGTDGAADAGETKGDASGFPPDDDGPVAGGVDFGPGPFLDGDCDPMVPTHCGFPFPSNVYLTNDESTDTHKRVEFGPTTLPKNQGGVQSTPDNFRFSDGFSPGVAPMTHLPGATVTGLPTPLDIPRSLEPDSPTVMINAETGERVPHFAELDMTRGVTDDQRAFMIRPVVRPADATRYIVAIRNVVDESGKPLEPSSVFKALRDGEVHDDPSVERRRDMYDDIFRRLEAAGVARDDLQIAWDYTTASTKSNTGWMLHIRDEGLETIGPDGPDYEITDVQTDVNEYTKIRIEGKVTVPLYLDQPGPGGQFVLGPDGMPEQNGTTQYDFLVLVPQSAADAPGVVVQNGHGLLGDRTQVEGFADRANEANWVLVAMDWIGFASEDVGYVIDTISNRDIGDWKAVSDRLCQGYLTRMAITRLMRGKFAQDPAVQINGHSAIDTTTSYYFGGSQGGIYGAVLLALSPDIPRGVIAVPGQPYNLLLNRSVDFDLYYSFLNGAYPNGLDVQLVLAAAQMLWDRSEPTGYSEHIVSDPFPGTPSHDVLMQVSIGDQQVNNIGSHIMARAIGLDNLAPANRPIWGIDEVEAPFEGSAMFEMDFGNAPDPIINVAPDPDTAGPDPHGRAGEVPAVRQMVADFLATGQVEMLCDGPCDPD